MAASEDKNVAVDDAFLKMVSELINGLEALIPVVQQTKASLQKMIEWKIKEAEGGWDPNNIVWVEAEGPSGVYQLATGENNQGNVDFEAMLKDLEAHGGRLTRANWFFWRFQQKPTHVGRKPVKRTTDAGDMKK
jgi:hypothetical protein